MKSKHALKTVILTFICLLIAPVAVAMQKHKRHRGNMPTEQLCNAAVECDLDALRTHLAAGGNPTASILPSRQSALHLILENSWEAETAIIEGLRLLLKFARTPDPKDENDQTPLHYAAARGSLKATRILLQAGANPNTCCLTREATTPLQIVSRRERRLGRSFMTYSDTGQDDQIAQYLIAAGAKPNAKVDEYPLANAIFFRKAGVARALLNGGANMHIKHSDGTPLLHLAAKQFDEATTHLLLEKDVDTTTLDDRHQTALQASPAIQSSAYLSDFALSFRITRALLESGAKIEEKSTELWTQQPPKKM